MALLKCVVFTDTHSREISRSCYHAIDMDYALFRMKFEDELIILVLRNTATLSKKLGVQNR